MVIEGVKAGRDFRQVDEGDASAWRRPDDGRRLRDQDLRANAEKLGLDIKVFDKELAEHVHAERIHEDFLSGVRSGVNGTPTFTSMVRGTTVRTRSSPCSALWSEPGRQKE